MYTTIKFMEPLIEFIKTCPFIGSDTGISVMQFNTDAVTTGSMIAYAGTGKPRADFDILGNVLILKQANFILYIRRPSIDDIYRLETADFLYNFESWVEYENFMGSPPRFGDTATERIWADNGTYWSDTNADVTEYMVQIHIEYHVEYTREGN